MNLITFSPIDKYRRVQFIAYMVLIYMFVVMFGATMNVVSYEKECHKLFDNSSELYTFEPLIETREGNQLPYLKSLIESIGGIDYDTGIDDTGFVQAKDGHCLLVSEEFEKYLTFNLKKGSGFSQNPNEVIIVYNHSGHKVGDWITITYEKDGAQMEQKAEVVGIMRYPIMAQDNGGGATNDGVSMDGLHPYSYYVGNYAWSYDENVYLLNPLLDTGYDWIKEDICYIYLKEDNIQTQSVLNTLMQYGDVEWMQILQQEEVSFWGRDESVLQICLLLAFICGVVIYNYIDMKRRRREFGIYFMLGMTWRQTIRITVFANIMSFALGFLLAEITLFRFRRSEIFFPENIFRVSNQLIIAAGILIVYILSMLPVYFEMRRVNPITLIQRKE